MRATRINASIGTAACKDKFVAPAEEGVTTPEARRECMAIMDGLIRKLVDSRVEEGLRSKIIDAVLRIARKADRPDLIASYLVRNLVPPRITSPKEILCTLSNYDQMLEARMRASRLERVSARKLIERRDEGGTSIIFLEEMASVIMGAGMTRRPTLDTYEGTPDAAERIADPVLGGHGATDERLTVVSKRWLKGKQ